MSANSYATDGLCHNAEPGTFNHECGKPAAWVGTTASGFSMGFCDRCKQSGWERASVVRWICFPTCTQCSGSIIPKAGILAQLHDGERAP